METRRQAHCVYRCMYHVVWIPRYRYKVLVKGVAEYLAIKLDEVRKWYPGLEYVERNIQPDHIHVVVSFPPKYSIEKMVQVMIKTLFLRYFKSKCNDRGGTARIDSMG